MSSVLLLMDVSPGPSGLVSWGVLILSIREFKSAFLCAPSVDSVPLW